MVNSDGEEYARPHPDIKGNKEKWLRRSFKWNEQ